MKITQKFSVFLIACLGVFIFSANFAKAAEGDCHLVYCYVPAPTVLGPVLNQTVSSRPAIIGLTWKTTIVKVFLDGQELKDVKQVKHEDYYGSFWASPDFDLKPGRHFVYTIAYSEHPSEFGQSQESVYIYFNVPVSLIEPVAKNNTTITEIEKPTAQIILPSADIIQPGVIVEPARPNNRNFEVEAGKIEGGVSVAGEGLPELSEKITNTNQNYNDLQPAATYEQLGDKLNEEFQSHSLAEKMKRNRIIGLSLLGFLILAALCWLFYSRFTIKHELEKEVKGEVPEPPQASRQPEATDWSVSNIDMEPIDLAKPSADYWGEPADRSQQFNDQSFQDQDHKDNENNWK